MSPRSDTSRYIPGRQRRLQQEAVLASKAPAGASGPPPLTAVTGTIVDASPHLLVLYRGPGQPGLGLLGDDEIRLPLTPDTSVWHGGRAGLPALRPGREAVVRPGAERPGVDRIWVDIVRVTGTIVSCSPEMVEVDAGPHRGHETVLIPSYAMGRVMVRHPRLEPGYLIDLITTRSPDGLLAAKPGTSQPGYRADDVTPPARTAPAAETLQGTATWFSDPGPAGLRPERGVAYPAVDPEGEAGGCADAPAGCVGLPYLSTGSEVRVRNECTSRSAVLPVVECGCVAARFCDRCVECGTSPRGRIVELSRTSFVELGGDLDAGCFNVSLTMGEQW